MDHETLTIAELAEAASISRRAIRFYVQRGLLPPPTGLGRGAHYERRHLELLHSIQDMQRRGYALDAIRRRLDGEVDADADVASEWTAPMALGTGPSNTPSVRAWLRVSLGAGVELHFDPTLAPLGSANLRALRDLLTRCLDRPTAESTHPDRPSSALSSAERDPNAS